VQDEQVHLIKEILKNTKDIFFLFRQNVLNLSTCKMLIDVTNPIFFFSKVPDSILVCNEHNQINSRWIKGISYGDQERA